MRTSDVGNTNSSLGCVLRQVCTFPLGLDLLYSFLSPRTSLSTSEMCWSIAYLSVICSAISLVLVFDNLRRTSVWSGGHDFLSTRGERVAKRRDRPPATQLIARASIIIMRVLNVPQWEYRDLLLGSGDDPSSYDGLGDAMKGLLRVARSLQDTKHFPFSQGLLPNDFSKCSLLLTNQSRVFRASGVQNSRYSRCCTMTSWALAMRNRTSFRRPREK